MNVEIVELKDRQVLGYTARIRPMEADYGELWGKGFDPHQAEVAALAVEPGYYGVYYASGEPGLADFVAGMVVGPAAAAPAGLVLRAMPGGTYARFDATLATIGATWGRIYGEWLPTSGYAEDESRPAIEYYPPAPMAPDSPVHIYIAIKPR